MCWAPVQQAYECGVHMESVIAKLQLCRESEMTSSALPAVALEWVIVCARAEILRKRAVGGGGGGDGGGGGHLCLCVVDLYALVRSHVKQRRCSIVSSRSCNHTATDPIQPSREQISLSTRVGDNRALWWGVGRSAKRYNSSADTPKCGVDGRRTTGWRGTRRTA
jgi:hypothetical protein